MKTELIQELRFLLPAWIGAVLLPLPAIVFWHAESGRRVAIWLFFVGCTSLVAYAFRPDTNPQPSDLQVRTTRVWRRRMAAIAVALFAAAVTFSLLCLALNNPHDLVAVFLAFSLLIPSFCVVPWLTLLTRKPFAAVVFTLSLVGLMKLLGCLVVVLVYGWHADAQGYTQMSWMHPNLLVWLFWFNNGVLSLSFYFLGKRRFLHDIAEPKSHAPPEKAPLSLRERGRG